MWFGKLIRRSKKQDVVRKINKNKMRFGKLINRSKDKFLVWKINKNKLIVWKINKASSFGSSHYLKLISYSKK